MAASEQCHPCHPNKRLAFPSSTGKHIRMMRSAERRSLIPRRGLSIFSWIQCGQWLTTSSKWTHRVTSETRRAPLFLQVWRWRVGHYLLPGSEKVSEVKSERTTSRKIHISQSVSFLTDVTQEGTDWDFIARCARSQGWERSHRSSSCATTMQVKCFSLWGIWKVAVFGWAKHLRPRCPCD